MLSFLKGILVAKKEVSPKGAYFVLEQQGLGFEILSSSRSVASSPAVGDPIQLHTSMIVREDAIFLVGFNSIEERDLFNILQNASGVGVKVSLALLSALSVSEIAQSVVSGNFKPLTSAKGVGPKLAQKMVLDLKEKMNAWRELAIHHHLEAQWEKEERVAFIEAETVLLSLGYSSEEVMSSFKELQGRFVDQDPSSEEVLKESLRWLATV
jgi:holliday junction DNA helicase RuvA